MVLCVFKTKINTIVLLPQILESIYIYLKSSSDLYDMNRQSCTLNLLHNIICCPECRIYHHDEINLMDDNVLAYTESGMYRERL